MKVSDAVRAIEAAAPLQLQDEWDNSGLQVGFPDAEIHRVLTCLDVTEEVLNEASERGCDMIVSHHPLLFHPLRQVSCTTYQQRCVVDALRHGIAIYSAHTSLDNAPGGINYRIAYVIGLEDLHWLQPRPCMDGGSGVIGTLQEAVPDTEFWTQNWRKGGLYERRNQLLREYNFYNQQYCGCEFSLNRKI